MGGEPPEGPIDFRESDVGRKRSWYGVKRHVKSVLGWRVPNWLMRKALVLRPALIATGRLPAPAHLKEVAGTVDDLHFVMLRPDRCVVAKELYWGGGRRPRPQDRTALETFARLARGTDVLVDVGAYTGIFTLVGTAADEHLHAHAFELVPEVFRTLLDNCVRNGVLHRVTLHHEGVGTDGDVVTVPIDAAGSALPDFFSRSLHFSDGVKVRLVSLDTFAECLPHPARVVMKIDVEGTEDEIFATGQRFLETFRPDIVCEVLSGVADGPRLDGLLEPHGYGRYLIREHDLLQRPRIEPHERYRDWLFTTKGPDELRSIGVSIAPTGRDS